MELYWLGLVCICTVQFEALVCTKGGEHCMAHLRAIARCPACMQNVSIRSCSFPTQADRRGGCICTVHLTTYSSHPKLYKVTTASGQTE